MFQREQNKKERNQNTMTEREYLTKSLAIENLPQDMKDYAKEKLASIDARNEKRRNTLTKAQKDNLEITSKIVELVKLNKEMIASEIGTALEISTQKASSLCRSLVASGVFTESDYKIKGKGTVKLYSWVEEPTE